MAMWEKNKWQLVYEGKVRQIYEADGVNAVAMVAGDGVSAFDHKLGVVVPGKGKILTHMSASWMGMIESMLGIPTALITADTNEMEDFFRKPEYEGRATLQLKLRMLPAEIVLRGYNTGTSWKMYSEGKREICGQRMPDGMREFDKFPEPLLTPTTKAPEGMHDENITLDQMRELFVESDFKADLVEEVRDKAFSIWNFCTKYAEERGIIIIDTKFEFGVDENGVLRLADEAFTPDSSRFIKADEFRPGESKQPSLDKQVIRDWIKAHPDQKLPDDVLAETAKRYQMADAMLTG